MLNNLINRYPGTRAFLQTEHNIFNGRKTEINKLSELIAIEKIVVLYGNIGSGKTSLVNAGLIPKITADEKPNILNFSFNHNEKEEENTIFKNIHEILFKNEKNTEISFLEKIIPNENTLWYHLKKYQINNKNSSEFLIIIDDFDNFFTYSKTQQQQFKQELSTLLYTKVPQNIRNEFNKKYDENPSFLSEEQVEILFEPLNVKLLIVINSENLSKLNNIRDFIPGVMQYFYELNPISLEKAYEAIEYPALFHSSEINFASQQFEYEEAAINKIVEHIYFDGERTTDLFQLQVICSRAEQIAIEKQKNKTDDLVKITIEDLGDLDMIFKDYYENLYKLINNNESENLARLLIEEGLIFEDEKYRLSMYEGLILKNYNIQKELLLKIVDYQILRLKTGTSGRKSYEISHDVFLPTIIESKKIRREAEEAKKRDEMLKANRKKIIKISSVICLFIITLILTISLVMISKAEKEERLAKEESQAYSEQANILLEVMLERLNYDEKKAIYDKTDSIIYEKYVKKENNYSLAASTAEIYCQLYDNINLDKSLRAEAYANYGWYLFFTKDYKNALENIEKAYDLDSNILWIKENLAIAYFFNEKFKDGSDIYFEIKDSIFTQLGNKFSEQFINDLRTLDSSGVTPPNKEKIEELMGFELK